MIVTTRFTLDAPLEVVWRYLLDIARIAPCVPGAQLLEVIDDRTYAGKIGVKLGPIDVGYVGRVRIDQIEPYMTPGPGLVTLIEADEDFRDRHFSSFYADGLTPDQARVLRAWCRDNEIAEVPLAPTISFANWIYLGYFLTALLQGHVLQAAY